MRTERGKYTYQFVRTDILRQVPLLDSSGLVAANELPLIWMDHNVVHCFRKSISSWNRAPGNRHTGSLVVIIPMEVTATSESERTLRAVGGLDQEKDAPKIPYLDSSILASGDQPLPLTVKTDCGDISVMTLEYRDLRIGTTSS